MSSVYQFKSTSTSPERYADGPMRGVRSVDEALKRAFELSVAGSGTNHLTQPTEKYAKGFRS